MELVSDLSTERFLEALYRFFARRGKSVHLNSDNGTNFIAAARELDHHDLRLAIKNNTMMAPVLEREGI